MAAGRSCANSIVTDIKSAGIGFATLAGVPSAVVKLCSSPVAVPKALAASTRQK